MNEVVNLKEWKKKKLREENSEAWRQLRTDSGFHICTDPICTFHDPLSSTICEKCMNLILEQ